MANVFNRAKLLLATGALDLSTADLRCLLLRGDGGSPYSYDPDDVFVADLTDELSVGGYVRQALTGLSVTQDDANDRANAEADQVEFPGLAAGETIAAAVVFQFVTNDADSILVGFYDVSPDLPTNGGNVTIQFSSADPGDFLRLLDS